MTAISRSVKRKSRRDERGQVVAMAPILMLLFLGIGALAVDVGFWLVTRTKLQADADAMALAGGLELPDDVDAEAKAREWGLKNGITAANIEVNAIRFDPDPSCKTPGPSTDFISVTVRRDGPPILSGLLGIVINPQIRACATAAKKIDSAPYAIFANHSCPHSDTLQMSGQNGEIFGRVHTNCILKVSGSNIDFNGGPVTYQEPAPPTEWKGEGATSANESPPARDLPLPDPQTWDFVYPFKWKSSGGVCDTITNGKLTLDNDTGVPDGVHCATGEIDIPANNQTATVTFISRDGPLKLSGNNLNFTSALVLPGGDPLLLFSYSANDDAIVISGQSAEWRGVLYAPRGGIVYSASNGVGPPGLFFSSIVGDRVSWSGSNYELHGISGQSAAGELALIE
jgi:hypothetical protein